LDRGVAVRALDDLSRARPGSLEAFTGRPGYLGLTQGDVTDPAALRDGLMGVDTVFHLAASVDVGASVHGPVQAIRANVLGTLNVLEAARASNLRLVLVSTCHVYASADGPLDERAATAPASPYAASKLAADDLAAGYRRAFGLRLTIVRPFNVYGPWQRGDLEGGVVARFVQAALAEQMLEVHGDGAQTRDFLFVADAARGVVDASAETAVGHTLNLATGRETSIRALAALIDDGAERVRQAPHPHPQAEVERYLGNAALADELLGWRPRVVLPEGLARTRAWFSEVAER
ncbi:MAG: GDP-mannose 4,6-dehydratase, partial [Chloroflexi bacterium]|nr:GDP-mannose 4,6-dehydratase [Chloroflexota bacterium]